MLCDMTKMVKQDDEMKRGDEVKNSDEEKKGRSPRTQENAIKSPANLTVLLHHPTSLN